MVDTTENNKEKAVVILGTTTIIHDGKKFEELYKIFYDKFDWARIDPWWKQRKAAIIEVIPKTKASWGI